jgi:hypothetical protein
MGISVGGCEHLDGPQLVHEREIAGETAEPQKQPSSTHDLAEATESKTGEV